MYNINVCIILMYLQFFYIDKFKISVRKKIKKLIDVEFYIRFVFFFFKYYKFNS